MANTAFRRKYFALSFACVFSLCQSFTKRESRLGWRLFGRLALDDTKKNNVQIDIPCFVHTRNQRQGAYRVNKRQLKSKHGAGVPGGGGAAQRSAKPFQVCSCDTTPSNLPLLATVSSSKKGRRWSYRCAGQTIDRTTQNHKHALCRAAEAQGRDGPFASNMCIPGVSLSSSGPAS